MKEERGEYAFISDIHSNLEGLGAVLDEVGGIEVFCLGDMVGYGASPNQVLELLRKRNVTCIIGNHDFAAMTRSYSDFNSRAAVAAAWTSNQLTEDNMHFLQGLPRQRAMELAGEKVFLTHGSPEDNLWEYVLPATHSDLFDYYLEKLSVRVIALGHTHYPFVWSGKGGTIFNPGSVGQPRDGDRRASYAILRVGHGDVDVEHKRVEYDVEASAKKIIEAGLPPSLANRLFTGD
jgi:putative phosphoesterase